MKSLCVEKRILKSNCLTALYVWLILTTLSKCDEGYSQSRLPLREISSSNVGATHAIFFEDPNVVHQSVVNDGSVSRIFKEDKFNKGDTDLEPASWASTSLLSANNKNIRNLEMPREELALPKRYGEAAYTQDRSKYYQYRLFQLRRNALLKMLHHRARRAHMEKPKIKDSPFSKGSDEQYTQ